MIFVGRHVNGAPRREFEPAADAEGIEHDDEGDEGAFGRGSERGRK